VENASNVIDIVALMFSIATFVAAISALTVSHDIKMLVLRHLDEHERERE
jgi:hypothetical protein